MTSDSLPTRAFGRTGHHSSVVAFGAAALAVLPQPECDRVVEEALARGINHFDVAPSYGDAELLLGPSVARHRGRMFLACKTRERKRWKARAELDQSLRRLRTDHLDLYQCHAIGSATDVLQILGPRGALEAFAEAKEQGLVRFLGLTGHHCGALEDALRRFPFDSVMFPLNPLQAALEHPAADYRPLLRTARELGVAPIGIKAIAWRPWPNGEERSHHTWYQPLTGSDDIRRAVHWSLSHDIATTVLPSDTRLWPEILAAAASFSGLTEDEAKLCIASAPHASPLFEVQVVPARQAYGPA